MSMSSHPPFCHHHATPNLPSPTLVAPSRDPYMIVSCSNSCIDKVWSWCHHTILYQCRCHQWLVDWCTNPTAAANILVTIQTGAPLRWWQYWGWRWLGHSSIYLPKGELGQLCNLAWDSSTSWLLAKATASNPLRQCLLTTTTVAFHNWWLLFHQHHLPLRWIFLPRYYIIIIIDSFHHPQSKVDTNTNMRKTKNANMDMLIRKGGCRQQE